MSMRDKRASLKCIRALTALLALACTGAAVTVDEVQRHKDRMNEAQDIKYLALDAFAANDAAALADAAAKLPPLLEAEAAYWERTGLADIHSLAEINLRLATDVQRVAARGDIATAREAWARLERSCSACHDLRPEQRVTVVR